MDQSRYFTLRCSCPDRVGTVARVACFIADAGGWILRSSQPSDGPTERFYRRVEIEANSLHCDRDMFAQRFVVVADELDMAWQISDSAARQRIVILVSRQMHCLYDLLERWSSGELRDVFEAVRCQLRPLAASFRPRLTNTLPTVFLSQ